MKTIALVIIVLLVVTYTSLLVLRMLENARVNRLRKTLQVAQASKKVFSPEMIEGLPETAQRYVHHAIAPGTPLSRRVEITMTGEIQPKPGGAWMPFTAQQIITPGSGFVWQATARQGVLSMQVTDSYAAGVGKMRVALFGLIPMVSVSNPDVSKSAAGRLAGETVWLPVALLPINGAVWEGIDRTHARVTVSIDGMSTTVTLTIDEVGRVTEVVFPRWNDEKRAFVPFGVIMEKEATFDGYTIPVKIRAGWGFGTDTYREFFRATILQVRFY